VADLRAGHHALAGVDDGPKYDPSSSYWYSFDAVRQSLHTNARGHAQLGRCLTEFAALAESWPRACVGPTAICTPLVDALALP
jgi:hypothetical protein